MVFKNERTVSSKNKSPLEHIDYLGSFVYFSGKLNVCNDTFLSPVERRKG